MKKRINRLISVAKAAAFTLLFLLADKEVRAAGRQVMIGHVPKLAAGLKPIRHLDATNRLRLAISLPLRDKQGLTNLLEQIYEPASPNFRHYLTAEQFAERFGPSVADYKALEIFLSSNNLVVTERHPNRTLLDVSGSVADIERVFHVKIQVYQHPTQNRTFYAPNTDPSVNLNVPLLHIIGLDNAILPFPKIRWKPVPRGGNGGTPKGTGSGPDGCYQGYDFRDAYVPGVALTGTGQSVSLFELDGYFSSDVLAYESQTGLPDVPLKNVLLDGFDGVPQSFDGDTECTLDIDMAIAMAPGISAVYVYEGYVPDDILNKIATDNISRQISCSWGWEPIGATTDQIFQEFGVQGQTFYDASGDDCAETEPDLVMPPSDDPYITQVGGTTLTTSGPLGSWVSETVWNWGAGEGSSGGISFIYPIPTWQMGINMSTNGGSTSFRNYPDVALTADNIFIIADQGFGLPGTGGTSCAAPLWAGFTALVNEQAAAVGQPSMGFINPAIYALAKGPSYDEMFHDITVGNDTNFVSPTEFYAYPGYDLCTGWGTPMGSNLINALAPPIAVPVFSVVTNIISGGNGNGVIDFDECNNLTIIVTNSGKVTATGVEGTLSSTTFGAIVAQSTSAYPDIFPGNSSPNLTYFTLSTLPSFVCGTPVNLTLVMKCDQVVQTNYIQLPSGVLGSPDIFTNTTAIPIPSTNFVPVNSPIVVSGLESVGSLTVSIYLSALYDAAMTLTLISPSGTNVILSQQNGGDSANYGTGCASNSETIFDDAAPVSILNGTPPFVGSFQPQQPLSVFHLVNGTNLNGTWILQVQNEFPGNTAELGCWSLNISPEVCIDGGGQCKGADLSLSMSASPHPVFVGSNLVYTMTVSNTGPGQADNVTILQTLPAGDGFVTTSNYPVNVNQAGQTLEIVMGSLPVYGSATVSVITIPTLPGLTNSSATVGSQEPDPDPANNSASVNVLVSEPTADVAVSITGSPSALLEGELLTYTIDVTNNGPFTAENVTLATTLPANVNFVSATVSQGTVTNNGAFAALGNIPQGTNVVLTIVISPTTTGSITASTVASITNTEIDPNTLNNSASVSTTVGAAADLGVTGFASNSPVIEGSNLTYILTVSNSGPSAATGVTFSQTLPTGSTFVTNSLAGYTVSNNSITAIASTNLASGGSVLVTTVVKAPTNSEVLTSIISVSGQPGDPNSNNNVLTLQTIDEPSTVTIVSAGATVTSGSANGSVGTTGTYGVKLYLQNVGNIPTPANLVATLENIDGVTGASAAQNYGILTNGAAPTAGQYSFTANGTNGGTIMAVLQLQAGSSNLGTVTNIFVMPVVQAFSNTNFISIPNQEYIPSPDQGPANPYRSTIVVSNVDGDVSAVAVTVSNLFHTYPADIGMLLIGPTGANCVLMSAAAQHTTMYSGATVTFSQSAPSPLPSGEGIVTGFYQPADYFASFYGATEAYTNSLAPTGPYNTNLVAFSSLSANGTWSLYVYDFAEGDSGAISNGWSLAVTTITPVNQEADLAAGITASASQVVVGNNVTNVWTVTNNGPDAAAAFVTNVLPAGLAFVTNILPAGATSSQTGSTNFCSLGSIPAGGSRVVTNVLKAVNGGPQTNVITVGVSSAAQDPDPVNNSASVVTTVTPPPVYLSLAPISAAPNPVVLSNNLTYRLSVTNQGPSNAFDVVGTLTMPRGLQFVSAVLYPAAGASYVYTNGSLACSFGTIAVTNYAEVTVTATAVSVGIITNEWSVTTTCTNLNYSNSSNTALVTVIYPVAVITNGPAILVSQNPAPFNGAINANQTNTVSFTLLNIGSGATTNLVATMLANSGIRPVTVSRDYGSIPAGGLASQSFAFVGSGSSGATLTVELSLQDGNNTNLGPVFYTFVLPVTQTFYNSGVITIPDEGPGNPYPSEIQVSGLTNGQANMSVSGVTATLNGFTHSWPHDVEAILVGPAGQELVLMEHTGTFYSVSNLVLTFEDGAAQKLPLTNTLITGTFLATEFSPLDIFPGLAAVPGNSTNFTVFNGSNPNGIWSLYVFDDTAGNDGVINNGWSLGLTAISPVPQLPTLSAASVSGELQLTVNGFSGQTYGVQISSNLVSWTTVETNTGSFTFLDSLTNRQQFYRVILLP